MADVQHMQNHLLSLELLSLPSDTGLSFEGGNVSCPEAFAVVFVKAFCHIFCMPEWPALL